MDALVTTAKRNVGIIWVAIVNGAEKIDINDTVIISVNETQASGRTTPETLLKRANKTTIMTIIIKLMKTDPERYQALSEEIFRAYAEGRVK